MTREDMDYVLKRVGSALIAAGASLSGTAAGSSGSTGSTDGATSGSGSASNGSSASAGGSDTTPAETPIVIDTVPALGEVAVIASRAPLREEPTKDVDPVLGRLLEGEKVPLDAISENKKWYRVDVRNFAGLHTIPDDATYAWAEASNFEIITLN